MKIAERLIHPAIGVDNEELKFLLWCTLIQLSTYCDEVNTVEEESFDVEEVLDSLDVELGMIP